VHFRAAFAGVIPRAAEPPTNAACGLIILFGEDMITETLKEPADNFMMNCIVVPLYRRDEYIRTVLEALDGCVGIERYMVLLFLEPGWEKVEEIARTVGTFQREVVINQRQYGCNANIYQCLEEGFKRSEYIIALEDDVVPSRDMLQYFEYCRDVYAGDSSIFSVCTYNNADLVRPDQ
jgi:hypothetical protein